MNGRWQPGGNWPRPVMRCPAPHSPDGALLPADPADLSRMQDFIRRNTRRQPVDNLALPHLSPPRPMQLWLADEITPIWSATEADLQREGLEPPFWAFAWAGGQAVARLVLERPEIVAGQRVLDIACGSGMVAIAAAAAGAAEVSANDIDPICEAALCLNAAANGVAARWLGGNLLDTPPPDVDVILAGDIFYEQAMAARFLDWLVVAAARGVAVYAGDPGRAYAPDGGAPPVAEYDIAVTMELESALTRRARVWRL